MIQLSKTLLHTPTGLILVLYRSATHPHYAGHPDLPGGEAGPSEDPQLAAARELQEETGIVIPPAEFQLVKQQSETENLVYLLYQATINSAAPLITLSWEHSRYDWLTPAQIIIQPPPVNSDTYYEMVLSYLQNPTKPTKTNNLVI